MLDSAFESLKEFDWGSDLAALGPIDDAVATARGTDALQAIEARLIAALNENLTRDAQDYICRKLAIVGSAAAVPALAKLLILPENSHMARFALEQIAAPEAGRALSDALRQVTTSQQVGIISTLGSRRDSAAISPLTERLKDTNPAIARAAAFALGTIGTSESAAVLQSALQSTSHNRPAVVDALLSCAESLISNAKLAEANSIYKTLAHESQPRLVRLAATRGLLSCAGKQA